jgi:mutator protein MutT
MADALECVAFIIRSGDNILAERRKMTKRLLPGTLALPGGHVDIGESIDDALARELREELGIVATRSRFVCTIDHHAEELRHLHYFAIEAWTGTIENNEAESLHWIALDDPSALDIAVDREALAAYIASRAACPAAKPT